MVLVPGAAVVERGVPVRDGEARGAFLVSSSLRAACTVVVVIPPAGVLVT